jgi:arylsulfatase A-like enzyme
MIISLDGMRPDAVTPQGTPSIFMLSRRGAYSWTAQTVLPSATLPGHASMLSGYDVPGHGLYWNDYIAARSHIRSATVFSIAHEHGFHTVMIVGKQKLLHIATPGTLDDFAEIRGSGDLQRADEAIEIIFEGFGVFFVHFRGPDNAGHRYGWMSPGYLEVVGEADMCVGDLLDALRWTDLEDTRLVILTSDHGGHGRTHGSDRPEDMTIPWIIAGPGVIPGLELTSEVRVYDTTATALWALGLPIPEDMDGMPVVEAFDERIEAECQLMEVPR